MSSARRIVTLTPVALERDSRTFKQAASIARLGHESVVVEGERSEGLERGSLPFDLRSPAVAGGGGAAGGSAAPGPRRRLIDRVLPAGVARALRSVLEPPYFAAAFLLAGVATARRTPPASLYYLHSFRQFPAVWLRSRGGRVPFVYDAHDFYPATYEELEPTAAQRATDRFRVAVEGICARRAYEVVTVSEGVADLFERRFGRRPLVLRNTHDSRIAVPSGDDLRTLLGLADDEFLIVALGQAKPGSAVSEAVDAVAALPDRVHLAFLGAGLERHQGIVEASAARERVHLVPPVPPPAIVPFVAGADLALLPYFPLTDNYARALPNGFFLSVAAGLPVLYPKRLGELAALAEEHGLGVAVDPQDPASVAGAVAVLLDDEPELERLRTAAMKAREALAWEREEQSLAEIIEGSLRAAR